jgi:hypothetical protein
MTEGEFTAAVSSGSVQAEAPDTESGVASASATESISITQFIPLLMQLESVQQCVSAAPTYIPQTFQDQIVFVFDGSNYFLYLYFNNQWNSFPVIGGGGSGVNSILAGFGISISGATGNVTITCTIDDATLPMSDITTNDVSISQHGFVPKLPNDATKFLNGVGAFSVPSGGGGVGSSLILIGSGTGTSYQTSGTSSFVDVDSTNLKGTISGLTAGAILLIRVIFNYRNLDGSGNERVVLNDLTNAVTIITFDNGTAPNLENVYYAEVLYISPGTTLQLSLQWKSPGGGSERLLMTNVAAPSSYMLIQSLGASGQTVSAPGAGEAVIIWAQVVG